jgi:23S rRNA pseudouridine2457 synthase
MKLKYILFNKPYGVLSQFTDEGTGHPTLKKYINIPEVYAAGRLDRDSEGLLLLTNDGRLISKLTNPDQHVSKTYQVQVEGIVTQEKLETLSHGVSLRGYTTLPCKVRIIPEPQLPAREKPITPHGPVGWLEVTLREGKKRQIRHMTAAVGLFTLRIVRVALGKMELGTLQPGQFRELTLEEIRILEAVE